MLVVPKKNGDIRLCLDGRKLNEKLMDYYESPPTVDEILLRCTKKPFMSSLDLTSSSWQIDLSEASKNYTALIILLWESVDLPEAAGVRNEKLLLCVYVIHTITHTVLLH